MIQPLAVIRRAFGVWWNEWIVMITLNAAWLFLQLPVITSAPATAVVYAMAQKSYDGEYWGPRDAWDAFRRLFWPAWRWGLVNGLFLLVVAFNLLAYRNAGGTLWLLLRLIWLLSLTIWLALNLFYWPFWLAQADRSMRTTYANCGRFLLLNPWPALLLIAFSGLLAAISIVTILPFSLALICWLALIGIAAVQRSLTLHKQ